MKKISIILIMLITSLIATAQENLVPNSTFQNLEKKVKEEGQIELALPWISPTLAKADLYSTSTKNSLLGVPENAYGAEKPMEGENYAGFLAYSDKNKEPRSYLQVKLTQQLEAGKTYCVTINVSLADLSKFATNYIGMTLTNNAISANNTDILKVENQIVSKKLLPHEQQFYWTPICGTFKAKGGEEFLTIGNFTPDEKLTKIKVKRPRGFIQPQLPDSYYFVDNISVVETTTPNTCDCDSDPAMKNVEVVNRNFNSDDVEGAKNVKFVGSDGSVSNEQSKNNQPSVALDKIDGTIIGFQAKSFAITDNIKTIDAIVGYLKANPNATISIVGHIDKSEADVEKLDGKRANSVYKYIVSKGIKPERLKRITKSSEEPKDAKDALKNMCVEIIEASVSK